jgi:hypothetical protein
VEEIDIRNVVAGCHNISLELGTFDRAVEIGHFRIAAFV